MSSIPNDCWETILRDDSFMDFTGTDIDFNSASDFLDSYNNSSVSESLIGDDGGYRGITIAPEHSFANNGYGAISSGDEGINPSLIEGHGGFPSFNIRLPGAAGVNISHNYGMNNQNTFPSPTWPLASAYSFQTESNRRGLKRPNSPGTLPSQGVHGAHSCLTSSAQGALDAGPVSGHHHAEPIDNLGFQGHYQ
ncbi:hypothetical protein PV08_01272 [Exophiala spinifera]|uniref:Uncharacterized protein n=1 Tax=Exophiala spinifera TaxID=91928 RepID=A0A0D2BQC8_9EURO|nr:uncharacterized protein PV08_01272 [Exophiala spinifera]KIW20695.1 hypothetical protein PV08_01272 [Exophiala spinifera]